MFPNEARLRNMTYGTTIHYDVDVEFIDILESGELPSEPIEQIGGYKYDETTETESEYKTTHQFKSLKTGGGDDDEDGDDDDNGDNQKSPAITAKKKSAKNAP
jgi:hypothetical protein